MKLEVVIATYIIDNGYLMRDEWMHEWVNWMSKIAHKKDNYGTRIEKLSNKGRT
jgi:hypothetical protein